MKKRSCTQFLAACALATFAGYARAEEQADAKRIAITLDEVRAFPEAYCRVPFELDLLYHGPRSLYNPFFTVFEPSSYANFAAWPAEAAIFERDKYVEDHPLFYYERKNTTLQQSLLSLKPYTWFSARCIVRSMAQGRAWIEVLQLTQVGAQLDTTDLRHLVKAHALAANGDFDRALLEIEMARLFSAPPRFIAQARREEGRVALAANQPERALLALQQAWASLPEDKLVAALLDRASAQVAMLRQSQVATGPGSTPVTPPTVAPAKAVRPLAPPPTPAPAPVEPPAAPKDATPVTAPVEPQQPTPAEPVPTPADESTDEATGTPVDPPETEPQPVPAEPPADVPADPTGAPIDTPPPATDEAIDEATAPATEPMEPTEPTSDDAAPSSDDETTPPADDESSDDELPPSDELPIDETPSGDETPPPAPDHGDDNGSDG
ncbi:MAG: hypothetical protein JNL90_09835 [Planctomycetes bacterium]|nr:hypothetical protein [Planctomycetota bacterium]